MISKLIGTLFLMAVGGGLTWYALAHHVVTHDNGTVSVPKESLTFTDTFVNITEWSASDWKAHPHVVEALVDAGHSELVAKEAGGSILDAAKKSITDIFTGDDSE